MIPEFATSVVLGLLVIGGLAFHDTIVERVAAIDRDPELVDVEDID